jgi:hypothetical protein
VTNPADAMQLFIQDPAVTVVNIDNKETNPRYGALAIVDAKWSSVSEQVADFVTLLEPQVEVDPDSAQNLLNGILFATNDFQSLNTSYLAFEVAGILMKKGATRQKAQQIAKQTISTGLPTNNPFFPPVAPMPIPQSVMQPQQQPQPQFNMSQQPQQQQWQAPVVQQAPFIPQEPVALAPVQPIPVQPQSPKQTPPDWLTPKVYKGSTVL